VIGASQCSRRAVEIAEEVGRGIAERGDIVVCGGLGGVMEAACRRAKQGGGITVGILPGADRKAANQYVDIPIATGFGSARNLVIVQSCDGLVAIEGGYGTLSEIAFASKLQVPMVGIRTWEVEVPLVRVRDAREALRELYSKI